MKGYAWIMMVLVAVECGAFFLHPKRWGNPYSRGKMDRHLVRSDAYVGSVLHASTPQKPLYDATNYTSPDTTTPEGIAEVLEASFVHACMQLRSGYVDVLKMFIAATMSSYQFGFPINDIQEALRNYPNQTANRSLMREEVELRHTWYSLVYLTLLTIDHPTTQKDVVEKSIPTDIKKKYGDIVNRLTEIYKQDEWATVSVEDLMKEENVAPSMAGLSELDQAVILQSTRVASLTLIVLREALEAGPAGGQSPPKPPIKGAFN